MRLQCVLSALAGFLLTACGSGGNSAGDPQAPIQRQSPTLNFPANSLQAGDVSIVRAFPNLSFDRPILLARAPGDAARLYVATQTGQVRVFDATDENVATSQLYLDLTDRTRASGEQGLLGLAFDPDYQTNGRVYVYYSANNPVPTPDIGDSVIARFTANPATAIADASSEVELLRFGQPFQNHNGGSIEFGADGMLYIASGDGGSGNDPQDNAQDLSTLLGKVLRIASDGSIPADNPFVGTAGARGEIWAYGLRNPFRMSFDRATGALWLGDVGQVAQEEVDLITRGGNYGWRVFEGTRCNTSVANNCANQSDPSGQGFTAPVLSYGRTEGRSITGGRVYRGSAIPELNGRYVYGDFASGTIWALTEANGVATDNVALGSVGNPSSFGLDLNDEIVVSAYDSTLRRLVPGASSGDAVPATLSATGLFTELADLSPAAGVVEYRPAAQFWSDGAAKQRWIAVPGNQRIQFSADGNWEFPRGTVTVKHFNIRLADQTTRRLETRVFVHEDGGWQGYTYRWRDDGSDADLLLSGESIALQTDDGMGGVRNQTYEIPSQGQCLQCHTSVSGQVLGLRSNQLNTDFSYANGQRANQLLALEQAGYFDAPIGNPAALPALSDPEDSSASVSLRARAYLETNCAQCHQPGGPTPVDMDLRAATPIAQTQTVGAAGTGPSVGGANTRIVAGSKETSLVWTRINTSNQSERMPPLGVHLTDAQGVALIGQWIDTGAN